MRVSPIAAAVVLLLPLGTALGPLSAAPARSEKAAKGAKPAARPGERAEYKHDILPLVKKYCFSCHGPANQTSGLGLHIYPDEASVLTARKVWERVADNVRSRHMPPKNMPQPTDGERAVLQGWIEAKLFNANCDVRDPGRVTIRRLNRNEYNNTVRDLLGVDFRPADDFPSDDVGYGFDNIGDVLSLSPIHLEKYLGAAEKIVNKAIVTPDPAVKRIEATDKSQVKGPGFQANGGAMLVTNGELFTDYTFPVEGDYILKVGSYQQPAGSEAAKLALKMDGRVLQTFDVAALEKEPKTYEFKTRVPAGRRHIAMAFLNDFYDQNASDPKMRDRNLVIEYIEFVGPIGVASRPIPESQKKLFGSVVVGDDKQAAARQILAPFVKRAFRRPATPQELDRLVKIVGLAQKEGDSFERGIQLAIEAVLVSPNFLFRAEIDTKPLDPKTSRPLNDYELASRLSYFLWSSTPDDALMALADKGLLKKPEILEAQVKRMLKDPKSQALTENFAGQWLTLRLLNNVNPDPKLFPSWSEALRQDMMKETQLFFNSIVEEDRNVVDLIDADYSFLNERLAKHYGVQGVTGDQFRRVTFPGGQRGGILTQGSILTLTSNPTRTSPVKRGKWVLEQVLGTPPPPPPPNVPKLDEPQRMLTGTLRERMTQHMKDPTCASCHSRMDPIGFGMENFNAVGEWREAEDPEGKLKIDSSGSVGGVEFQGPTGLRNELRKQSGQFTRNFIKSLLTYSLGRGLEDYDRCAVDQMVASAAKKGNKFSVIVSEIVQSEPFRKRRGEDSAQ